MNKRRRAEINDLVQNSKKNLELDRNLQKISQKKI